MLETIALWLLLAAPLFFFPGCVCCGVCTGENAVTCEECVSDTCKCWEITVSGITSNGSGSNCTNYNGTFELEWCPDGTGAGCAGRGDSLETCIYDSSKTILLDTLQASCANQAVGDGSWAFFFNVTIWQFFAMNTRTTQVAVYTTSDDPCTDETVVWSFNSSSCCTNWPSTITMTGVECSA